MVKTNDLNEIIKSFCAVPKTDPRRYLERPMRIGKFIYATNGHIGIRVPDDGVLIAKTIPAIADNIDEGGVFTIDRGDEILYNLDLGEHPINAGLAPVSEVPSAVSGGWTADNTQIDASDTHHTADET